MDYLSGKQVSIASTEKKRKVAYGEESHSGFSFSDFFEAAMYMLNADERIHLKEKFLTPEIVEVLEDKELVECVNAFFENNLNISETSRNAFLHRNTLLYRIDKIYKLTGLNIRNFEDAMSFRVLTCLSQKTNKENR